MSDTDGSRGQDDERPMLVLGDNRPDVEDTTPEELRRQQEEAQREIARQRRELQEEIDRRRREAEREIAELEATKERELRERERELEETQEKLYRRETRLMRANRTSTRTTAPARRLVKKPARRPLRERGLRTSGAALTLTVIAALGLGVGGLVSLGSGTSPALRAELDRTDEARILYLRSGLELDQAIVERLNGDPVTLGEGGSLPGAALRQEAVALVPGSAPYDPQQAEERIGSMVDEGTGTVRALTQWSQARQDADHAVPRYEVRELREEATGQGGLALALVILGLVALLALAAMAAVARAWVALPVLVVSAVLGALAIPAVSTGVGGKVAQAAEDHDAADKALGDVYSRIGRDLEAAFGTSMSSLASSPDYWERSPFYDTEPTPALESYLQAREAVGQARGDEATYAAAAVLLEAGGEAFTERVPPVEQARERLVAGLGETPPRGTTLLLTLGGAALAATGLVLSPGRKEKA